MKVLFQHIATQTGIFKSALLMGLAFFCLFSISTQAQTLIAEPDNLSINANTTQIINPLANDLGTDITLVRYTQPRNGSLSLNETTGELTYSPNPNYYGHDNFVYQITDAEGQTAEAAVFIDILHNGIMPLSGYVNYVCSNYSEYTFYMYISGGFPPYTLTGDYNGTVDGESSINFTLIQSQRYNINITDATGTAINVNNLNDIQPCLLLGITDIDP